MNGKKLLVISDTRVFSSPSGYLVFEPPLREMEEIAPLFESITWLTYQYKKGDTRSSRLPRADIIKILPWPDYRGGASWWSKLSVLWSLPHQIISCYKAIKKADVVHTRGPSIPALIGILFSLIDSKRTYWHKYAGNWQEADSPLSYKVQKYLLKRCIRPNVTISINGLWPALHTGFIRLENPCINFSLLQKNESLSTSRKFDEPLRICFVGTLDSNKGSQRLAQAFQDSDFADKIECVYFIGDGETRGLLETIAEQSKVKFVIRGAMPREQIFTEIYSTCHFLVLPSHSEGFPKVVAEAATFFCIPVVTNMSSLDQYIQDGVNGFLLPDSSEKSIIDCFRDRIFRNQNLKQIAQESFELSKKFTYEGFRDRVANEILNR
jgi:glycosyltransferase involved in cell wall biosynthesis